MAVLHDTALLLLTECVVGVLSAMRVELCGTAIVLWGDMEDRPIDKVTCNLEQRQIHKFALGASPPLPSLST